MAKIYKTNGEIVEVSPKNGTDFKCEELHEIVGGYFEMVYLPKGNLMVVNEEGKIMGLPVNNNATDIVLQNGISDIIAGDVLICKLKEIK